MTQAPDHQNETYPCKFCDGTVRSCESRKGTTFWGCSNYKTCPYQDWRGRPSEGPPVYKAKKTDHSFLKNDSKKTSDRDHELVAIKRTVGQTHAMVEDLQTSVDELAALITSLKKNNNNASKRRRVAENGDEAEYVPDEFVYKE